MIKLILNDIEGTTTPISYVHEKLFPYASKHLSMFVKTFADTPQVTKCLLAVNETSKEENGVTLDQQGAIALLQKWIAEDRKHTALKDLQGLIWKQGYVTGELVSELYEDVAPQLRNWHSRKIQLGVYSSGSVEAQKLLFSHTPSGDLSGIFSFFFDTNIGHKRDPQSYKNIGEETGLRPEQILFLSDIVEELDAARSEGFSTAQLIRPGTTPANTHPTCNNYREVDQYLAKLNES